MTQSIAIVGASTDRSKFGNRAVRAYLRQGWDVYPVHPTAADIEGIHAFRSVKDIPAAALDRISLYLPPQLGLAVLPELAQKPAREVWLNPGAESDELIARAKELGLNVIVGCSIVDVGVDPHRLD
jgi:predicted CoA-binding protein